MMFQIIGFGFMKLLLLAIGAIIAYKVFFLIAVKSSSSRKYSIRRAAFHHRCCETDAEEIVRERFASGEIDADEFKKRLEILHSN